MKTSTVAVVLAPAAASAQWWGGAPECAQTCLSSAWSSVSATAATTGGNGWWPQQSDYCVEDKRNAVQDCLAKDCSATPTAVSSYSSLASSLCSAWSSCTAAGSTGVHTITYPGGPVTWGAPGGWGGFGGSGNGPRGGNFGGPGGAGGWGGASDSQMWSEWADAYSGSKTWTGGVATVTGCVGNGSPWFAGPGGGWNNQGGFNGWVGWGKGWTWGSTVTQTVTYTTTLSDGKVSEFTGLATVAAAVSGDLTTSTTLGSATATHTSADNAGARIGGSSEGGIVTGMMGIALGAVVLVAGML